MLRRVAGVVSRAAASSEKFIRAGRSFPGSTVDDEGLTLLSVFQLDPKCCERLLHSPAICELGCTDGSWVPNPAGQQTPRDAFKTHHSAHVSEPAKLRFEDVKPYGLEAKISKEL